MCSFYSEGLLLSTNGWNRLIENLIREGILRSQRVIRAMRIVRRELFLPEHLKSYAAVDAPVPLGFGQTVSAPHS